LLQHTKTGKFETKYPQSIPNGHKIYQMAIKNPIDHVPYIPIFLNSYALQNLPKSGYLVRKYSYHLATLSLKFFRPPSSAGAHYFHLKGCLRWISNGKQVG
jgi:hypothetical protein